MQGLCQGRSDGSVLPYDLVETTALYSSCIYDSWSLSSSIYAWWEVEFWKKYQERGELYGLRPSNGEYNAGSIRSLMALGCSLEESVRLTLQSALQRSKYGLQDADPVLRVSGYPDPVKICETNMRPSTVLTLQRLEDSDWFVNVGKHDIEDPEAAVILSSWDEALENSRSNKWKNINIEVLNQYSARILERSLERYKQWNDVAQSLKEVTEPFVHKKIEKIVREHNLPDYIENIIRWDILCLCMEAEYADVYPPGFYAAKAFWYAIGHFPCGWDGDFPSGRIVVY